MADRLIRITTALAVLTVVVIAAIIASTNGCARTASQARDGARLVPVTVDGLIWAAIDGCP